MIYDFVFFSPVIPLQLQGVGDVITGRIEQGIVRPKDEVCFLPTHTASNACSGEEQKWDPLFL